METIKVNMNPNPLDVQTIHASQNDTEARQWEFELHNNGEKIDSSSISNQMVFKAYEGGTEQLLPENGSVPVTAPFLGDIRYPQGLLTDQEFTYRESPTESDGLAKITDIKGNTLVWNQLYKNTNIPTSQTKNGVTLTNNNDGSWTLSGTASANTYFYHANGDIKPIVGHKYLMKDCAPNGVNQFILQFGGVLATANSNNSIVTATSTSSPDNTSFQILSGATVNVTFRPQIFDLTQMFGAGNEPATLEEFTSLFPLTHYDYNAGTLLSFNGTGLKTGGENLIDFSTLQLGKNWTKGSAVDRAIIEFAVEENKEYTISFDYSSNISNTIIVYRTGWNTGQISNSDAGSVKEYTFTTPLNCKVVCVQFNARVNGFVLSQSDFYGFWNCALTDTFRTKALPVLTYFPTGMKSAGTVYDELTETKAATKIGSLKGSDIQGSVSSAVSAGGFHYVEVNGLGSKANGQGISNMLPIKNEDAWSSTVPCVQIRPTTEGCIRIYGAFTTFQEFQTQYASLVLYYELATPTETSFTTASLVTENAEIPLSNEDGVLIGKCTEQLSAEPGFHDAKIKLSDADGECYSNKLQLHVERSPQ